MKTLKIYSFLLMLLAGAACNDSISEENKPPQKISQISTSLEKIELAAGANDSIEVIIKTQESQPYCISAPGDWYRFEQRDDTTLIVSSFVANNTDKAYVDTLVISTATEKKKIPILQQVAEVPGTYVLSWVEHFDGDTLNTEHWSKIVPGDDDWRKYMASDDDLYEVGGGNLTLWARMNTPTDEESRNKLTGGVHTYGKVSFLYGKLEVRARVECAGGAWPAIWLLGDCLGYEPNESGRLKMYYNDGPWYGEIDMMEHLNHDDFSYQTIHNRYTLNGGGQGLTNPLRGKTAPIRPGEFNVYSIEWTPDAIAFFINGVHNFTYPRVASLADQGQWPFDTSFYLMLDMQLGGSWVGAIHIGELPIKMEVDWVRYFTARNL